MDKPKSFATAMKHKFGLKPGRKLSDFLQELKALSDDDKAEFRCLLIADGYPLRS